MFNALGNFTENPQAGLIFLDFESHRTLQLVGRPEVLYNVDGALEGNWRDKTILAILY